MPSRVVITGIGIITSIGNGISETLQSIRSLKSGIGPISILKTVHRENFPSGEIKLTDQELTELARPGVPATVTRTTLLGLIAAREAYISAGLKPGQKPDVKTGIVSATTVGGMDKTELHYFDFLNNKQHLEYVHTHDCCDNTQTIAEYLGAGDFMTTISTACSSSANAIMFGARLIRHGIVGRIIAGGTDALSKFTLNGFNTLKILDEKKCRPFSSDRMGLNLGEGAGFLVMESEQLAKRRNQEVLCELTGFANANDAYHQTASSPDGYGPFLAMKNALDLNGTDPREIGYINAHGTGTDNNDLTEGFAIEKIFLPAIPPVSSTKAFTGHTLGAAGAIEAVFSILSLKYGMILPNLNYSGKISELSFEPALKLQEGLEIRSVLSNSFGFGGNDSSLIFSKY
jgi:3-oxoacyl-[acyl-carrier-protein] synthase-1